jgi:amino acid transporter
MIHKNKKIGSELFVSILVLITLVLLVHPYWMPMGLVVIFIALLAVLVFGLGVFVWRERPKDEREYAVTTQSSRTAYLICGAILTLGVALQTVQHRIDIWLIMGLASMVLVKIMNSIKNE